MSRHLLGLS
ncbi:hypothetical protein VTO58DRAFT_111000 [Aureobasidium pullulans]